MTDTIRELINRVLDYVERTPGAYFTIARWDEGVRKPDKNQMHFMFFTPKEITRFITYLAMATSIGRSLLTLMRTIFGIWLSSWRVWNERLYRGALQ